MLRDQIKLCCDCKGWEEKQSNVQVFPAGCAESCSAECSKQVRKGLVGQGADAWAVSPRPCSFSWHVSSLRASSYTLELLWLALP